MRGKVELPEIAEAFLRSPAGAHARKPVGVFHSWLRRNEMDFGRLKPQHVDAFMEKPAGKPVSALTRNGYRYILCRYLDWLHADGAIDFHSGWLRVRRQVLPEAAESFLASLAPTLKPATVLQYRSSLRMLHNWLAAEGLEIGALTREHAVRWFQHLQARGQAPATRLNEIVAVRVYLRALNDANLLAARADDLVRHSDLPKLPTYLPRPLEPKTDEELRERLARSEDSHQRGLLVMRNTGLRVGELAALSHDCIREDETGRRFLKVPLGKLNNERLVPLDEPTYQLVRQLQQEGRPERQWLLESVRGHQVRQVHFKAALDAACKGLKIPNGMTTHRLRHTYATTLLNAGMSLMGVMKLLGHRDYRMTLRYTEITLETVGNEYQAALTQMETRYRVALQTTPRSELDPDQALTDIITWVQKKAGDAPDLKHRADLLVKRLKRIRDEVGDLSEDDD